MQTTENTNPQPSFEVPIAPCKAHWQSWASPVKDVSLTIAWEHYSEKGKDKWNRGKPTHPVVFGFQTAHDFLVIYTKDQSSPGGKE